MIPGGSLNHACQGANTYAIPLLTGVTSRSGSISRQRKYPWTLFTKWDFTGLAVIGCPMAGKQRYREFRIFPTYERAYRRAFAKMLELRKAAGRQCNSRLWSDVDAFFRWWMEDPGIPGQYELSFHEDTMRFIMTICSGREEELSQNINYLLDCSMKPGCWKSVFRTGWSFLLRSRH